ncbi:MAG: hypothetical protein JSU63_12975 [Phycisphaerales bacterium]|nr:MAG: hypothetical protein JSU63_12975 [Phycisphaerales bacterium]
MIVEDNREPGELRRCHVTGKWTLVPGRKRRSRGRLHGLLKRDTRQSFRLSWRGDCPFCRGWYNRGENRLEQGRAPNEAAGEKPGILHDGGVCNEWDGDWHVFTIKNNAPLLPWLPSRHQPVRGGEVLSERIDGIGFSEVVVESPGEHQLPKSSQGALPVTDGAVIENIRKRRLPWDAHRPLGVSSEHTCRHVLEMLLRRFEEMRGDDRIRYISVFRNHRPESGATLEHPHCQIIASPIIPARVADELAHARTHYVSIGGRCVVCELLEAEEARDIRLKGTVGHNESRVLHSPEGAHFVVIHPYASTVPFETWIIPRAHQESFGKVKEIENLARILTWTLGRLYVCLDDPAYNMVFKTAPFPGKGDQKNKFDFYHWYIVIQPQRLLIPGGYEMSTGINVNPAPPESEQACGAEDKYNGMGTVEFIKNWGFLFDPDPTKPGTLSWYQVEPTSEESEKLHITWESKQRTLRNIVEVVKREQHELTEEQKNALKEAEQAASDDFKYAEHDVE